MKWYFLVNIILVLATYFFVEKDAIEKLKKNRSNAFLFSEEHIENVNKIVSE